jgi:hypothetical protein
MYTLYIVSNRSVDPNSGEVIRLAPLVERSTSGFQSVFGVQEGRYVGSKQQPPAPWDYSCATDPTLVHGKFTVNSMDERRQAFELAVRHLREKAEWE